MSEVLKNLKLKKIDNLFMHDDADGIASAVLLTHVFKTKKVFCPEDFGVWDTLPDPANNYVPPDVVVDMVPQDPKWKGICFDHHPSHLPVEKRKYTLVWDEIPATGIIYNLFKESIPEDYRWKVAVGLVGDGQAQLIPVEIWKKYPVLLNGYSAPYEKYGRLSISKFPVYLRLSSHINAACKIPEKWYIAYQVLKNAKHPLDLFEDPALVACKATVNEEYKRVLKYSRPIDFPHVRIWRINTVMKLERTIGWKSENMDHKTTIVLNTQTKRISIRGVLSLVIYKELEKMGYKVNGHPGFGGGRLIGKQTPNGLIRDLQKVRLI